MDIGSNSLMGAFHLSTLWVTSLVGGMGEFMNLVFPV